MVSAEHRDDDIAVIVIGADRSMVDPFGQVRHETGPGIPATHLPDLHESNSSCVRPSMSKGGLALNVGPGLRRTRRGRTRRSAGVLTPP